MIQTNLKKNLYNGYAQVVIINISKSSVGIYLILTVAFDSNLF